MVSAGGAATAGSVRRGELRVRRTAANAHRHAEHAVRVGVESGRGRLVGVRSDGRRPGVLCGSLRVPAVCLLLHLRTEHRLAHLRGGLQRGGGRPARIVARRRDGCWRERNGRRGLQSAAARRRRGRRRRIRLRRPATARATGALRVDCGRDLRRVEIRLLLRLADVLLVSNSLITEPI